MSTVAGDGKAESKAGPLLSAQLEHPFCIALLHHTASSATFVVGQSKGFRTLTVTDTGVTTEAQLASALIALHATSSEAIDMPKPLWALIAAYAFGGSRFDGHVSKREC